LVAAAALETLKIMDEEKIVDRARESGDYFRDALKQLKRRHRCIVEVRGKGLLLGIQMNGPADERVTVFMEKGFLINCVQGDTLRFVPPLIIQENEIDALIQCLDEVLTR
jgi:acetylornithine/succinyldiaminopimelate/putrescine aminotransferase